MSSTEAPQERTSDVEFRAAPLYVDLDGTLVHTDMLFESLVRFWCRHPWRALSVIGWAFRGPAYLKARLAADYDVDVATLPWNQELLANLREQAASGRVVVLATAANENIARAIARQADCFARVLASTATHNLKGSAKADAIATDAGGKPFVYAGDHAADLPIWQRAAGALLVNASANTARRARQLTRVEREFPPATSSLRALPRALRMHQWLKNALVFVPLLAAHAWSDPLAWKAAIAMFFAFSLCASGIYLLNDLVDLPADRAHPRKKFRPLAAGTLPLRHGLLIAPVLLTGGLALALWINPLSLAMLGAYVLATTAYSLVLKQIVLVDAIVLACLYTSRVLGGAAAIMVVPSFWLLALSMFLFLSLALIKRYSELMTLASLNQPSARGRDYNVTDRTVLMALGVGSGFCAVLVMAMFLNSADIATSYARPQLLWGLCITLMYWVSRMWIKAARGEMHDDPIVYAVKDRASIFVAAMSAACVALAL